MNIFRKMFATSISKPLLVSLLAVGMALHLSGCAMGGSSDEEAVADGNETFAEESSGDFAEGEETAESTDEGDSAEKNTVAEGDELSAEGDDLSAEVADAGQETEEAKDQLAEGDDLALEGEESKGDVAAAGEDDELSLDDEGALPSDIAANDTPPPIIDEPPAAAPTDAPVFAETAPETTDETIAAAPVEPPAWVPLKKMKSAAFMVGDTNLNRVYLARPGDTKQSIAEKLYGSKSRAKDLSKWNGFLARGVKTGDKIYYSSPTNPTDTNMLTYFEDVGVPAQNYVTRDGDNIRTVSSTLLGDSESWKEVWSTNPEVESKGELSAGLTLRYWPDGSAPAAPVMASNTATPDPMAGAIDPLAQQPPGTNVVDPLAAPPADPLANNGMAPNDPVAQQQPPVNDPLSAPTGTPASESPPVAIGATEPPPPPPPAATERPARVAMDPVVQGTEEADNMMMMGLGGIVLLAVGAVFFLMRSRRSRKVDLTQTTQVG